MKLFHFTEASGIFTVEELEQQPFTPSDLQSEDSTLILDAFDQCFVWGGSKTSKKKLEACIETAKEYVMYSGQSKQIQTLHIEFTSLQN